MNVSSIRAGILSFLLLYGKCSIIVRISKVDTVRSGWLQLYLKSKAHTMEKVRSGRDQSIGSVLSDVYCSAWLTVITGREHRWSK